MDIGARLRSTREALGWSLGALAQKTRVQPRILDAIERNDLRSIPPKPFGRGFVRSYAREVGLDPESTVHDYFGQFPPAAPHASETKAPHYESAPPRPWLVPLAAVVVLVVLVASALRGGAPERDAATSDVVGTAGTESAPPAPAADREAVSATAAPKPSELDVVLTLSAESWVTATADGTRVMYRLLAAGTEETLHATREITVLAGNAGGVSLTINGRRTGTLGQPGEVRTVKITPDNAGSFR